MSFLIKRGKYYYYYRYVGENDNRKRISISLKVTTQSSAKILQQELDLKYARRDLGLRVVEPIAITRMIRNYLVWLDTVKRKSYYRRIKVVFDNFSKFLEDRDEVMISDIS